MLMSIMHHSRCRRLGSALKSMRIVVIVGYLSAMKTIKVSTKN